MDASISPAALRQFLRSAEPPIVIDVRRQERFLDSTYLLQGALRRNPDAVEKWRRTLPAAANVIVYCVHGHEVSQNTAKALGARYLEGGIEGWREAGGELDTKPRGASTRWVTRERPKIDRIACPWLVHRFVDQDAQFVYVPATEVRSVAKEREAVPYDIPDVHFSHEGELCSFDAFLSHYGLASDPALRELAIIVRGADTNRMQLAAQASGLAAISLGLSRNFEDDHEMLGHGMVMYDALYTWCKHGKDEVHTWNPNAYK
jgi:rhodanese-related sulfurtransferase